MERGAELGQRAAGCVGRGRGNSMCKALMVTVVWDVLRTLQGCSGRFPVAVV